MNPPGARINKQKGLIVLVVVFWEGGLCFGSGTSLGGWLLAGLFWGFVVFCFAPLK